MKVSNHAQDNQFVYVWTVTNLTNRGKGSQHDVGILTLNISISGIENFARGAVVFAYANYTCLDSI